MDLCKTIMNDLLATASCIAAGAVYCSGLKTGVLNVLTFKLPAQLDDKQKA